MVKMERSARRWWQKPLAHFDGQDLPAELVILRLQVGEGESGAWLNSRGSKSGTVDLVQAGGKFKSVRVPLPEFVHLVLRTLYSQTGLSKGAPDLVIWKPAAKTMRFIEVKCLHWDRPSEAQLQFHRAAEAAGYVVAIVEWEFDCVAPAA